MTGMENENQDQPVIQPGAKGVQRQPKGAKKRLGGAGRPKQTKPETWREIQRASEQGVSDEELSRTFGVTRGSIRQHRHREGWVSFTKLSEKVESMRLARDATLGGGGEVERPKTIELMAAGLLERGNAHSLRVFDHVSEKVAKAIKTDVLPIPDSWKTFQIADSIARRAAGLDKPSENASISVNLAMFTAQTGKEAGWTVAESPV